MARTALIRGISFPFRKGSAAFPEKASDDQLIKEDLYQLILTGTGSRVMRPTFGTNVYSFVFEPNNDLLAATIRAEIQTAVSRYEPRVSLQNIAIYRVDSQVIVSISYVVLATGNADAVDIRFSTP